MPSTRNALKPLAALLAAMLTSLSAAPAKTTFAGTVSDDMCAAIGHARMRMGANDAECTRACIDAHGASYVLVSGKQIYNLTDQKAPERFAGQQVTVVGALDAKTRTIHVESITAVKKAAT